MIRWGIISTGGIASTFASELAQTESGSAVAVGSRRAASAEAFGERFGIPNRHDSYEALVADPDVDAVYVGTPHPMHHEDALLALRAGKHVLCEKPFTMNAAEAEELVAEARQRELFLMEAMWARFLPHMREVGRERVRDPAGADDAPADHRQLLTSSTGCQARAPTPWPICWRQDTPVAATSVPGAASRSAGNSRCSPICIERS